jgi:hypothetical protein
MIIVMTYKDKKTGETVVDYGIDLDDQDRLFILPNFPVNHFADIRFDSQIGEYVLDINYGR